jgi:oxygen-independent coproporphyrinogen III oxidase
LAGIYIHIPFCKQACNYCNFHFSTSLQNKDALLQAMLIEINLTAIQPSFNKAQVINTIYFGGGTPSILFSNDIVMLLAAIQSKFIISPTVEITLEANPDDITLQKLIEWKAIGINRLSVGVQSFNNEELIWMNRAHTAKESLQCIDIIQQVGFTNYSIDLIYGSPLLSNQMWQKNVQILINKKVPHISCYALTVEPKTLLYHQINQQKKINIDTDKQAEQFLLLMQWMHTFGYNHYEISNYCMPNFESKHNSNYWKNEHYFAFGPAAHSFNGKSRRWNVANNALYIAALQNGSIPFEEEILTPKEQLNEYIMTSLRTKDGLSLQYVQTNFGATKAATIKLKANQWVQSNKAFIVNNAIILTQQGKLFADGIAVDFFEA